MTPRATPRRSPLAADGCRRVAERLLASPAYVKRLRRQAIAGTLPPDVEAALFRIAYGEPRSVADDDSED